MGASAVFTAELNADVVGVGVSAVFDGELNAAGVLPGATAIFDGELNVAGVLPGTSAIFDGVLDETPPAFTAGPAFDHLAESSPPSISGPVFDHAVLILAGAFTGPVLDSPVGMNRDAAGVTVDWTVVGIPKPLTPRTAQQVPGLEPKISPPRDVRCVGTGGDGGPGTCGREG